jgi:hypothetical protein
MHGSHITQAQEERVLSRWFAEGIRRLIAPLLLLASGFFTADFLLSGVYTWPRTSRVIVLTITVLVLCYEFVYQEHRAWPVGSTGDRAFRIVLYSCATPYAIGAFALLALAWLSF